MGTLTANMPRLAEHCPHKLATSCRLTATPNCCACADERSHSRTYRKYVDGVGFVQRGTRWEGYCWFCKEFWRNRLLCTDPEITPENTRIPEIPDQTEFLERWFEFYQGYRLVKKEDGSEERIAVLGEPFPEVSPGFLPRTLDQLRSEQPNDAARPENRLTQAPPTAQSNTPSQPQQSLDEALDSLLEEAESETNVRSGLPARLPPDPRDLEAAQAHAILTRSRAVEPVTWRYPQSDPQRLEITRRRAEGRARALERLEARERQLREAENQRSEITARAAATQERARERFARLFGTREEVQSDDYQSPLASMYNRAMERYRQAEERRQTGEPEPSSSASNAANQPSISLSIGDGPSNDLNTGSGMSENDAEVFAARVLREREANGEFVGNGIFRVRIPGEASDGHFVRIPGTTDEVVRIPDLWDISSTILSPRVRARLGQSSRGTGLRLSPSSRTGIMNPPEERPLQTLDTQPERPDPKKDEEMTVKLDCQVCYSQMANMACLPCGHMVMCQWCADISMPVRHANFCIQGTKCPMCRKKVQQRVKIHFGGGN